MMFLQISHKLLGKDEKKSYNSIPLFDELKNNLK